MAELLKFNFFPDKLTAVLLLFIVLLSASLRLIDVTNIPPGLYQDESAIGYNAYSILQTGKDEYGISHPLYFKSFGDYKLPVYIYLTAASIKIFGLNEFAVRFPSILAGILAVALVFLFVRYLTRNNTLAFFAGLILALNPIHLFFSRAGFEVNVALTFALAGCYFFILGATKKKFLFIVFSIFCFGFSLYSYNVTRLIAPLFLVGLVVLYWEKIKEIKLTYKIVAIILFLLILLPFLKGFFSASGVMSAGSTLITSTDISAKDIEFRSYISSLPHVYTALFYNKYIYMIFQYLENLATIISGSFFFVNGSTELNQGIGNVGFFYVFDLPFFILGLIVYYQKKIKSFQIFALWLYASVFVLALSKEVPQATRGYFLILPIVCFTALGMFSFFSYVLKYRNKLLSYAFLTIFVLFAIYNLQYYFLSYYFRFPVLYADAWRSGDKALSLYLKANDKKYDKIIIEQSSDFIYTSYLFYDAYPPEEFIDTAKRSRDGVLIKANAWGIYTIRQIDWEKDLTIPHTLLIAAQTDIPKSTIISKTIYNPTIFTVLSVNDRIMSAPQKSIKYVLVDTDKNIAYMLLNQQRLQKIFQK